MRDSREVLLVAAVCATGVFAGCGWAGSERLTERLPASAYTEDFDAAWTFIRDTYAYFDHEVVDWERVRVVLRPRAAAVPRPRRIRRPARGTR